MVTPAPVSPLMTAHRRAVSRPGAGDLLSRYGPTALVTGASSGIGEAIARQLAGQGFGLLLVARRADRLQVLADELSAQHGIETRIIAADMARGEDVARLIDVVRDSDIGLGVLAAGYGSSGPFLDQPVAEELDMIAVNCSAVVALSHALATRMAGRGRGGLMLFGSLVGWQGTPNAAAYAASKAFVQTFAEGVGAELRAKNVDVLAVAPGPVRTGFGARARMMLGAADDAERVARDSLAALGKRRTVVPGRVGKLLTAGLGTLPRRLRIDVMGRIMAGMMHAPSDGRHDGIHG
jgi:short-subunit dehydrogenase